MVECYNPLCPKCGRLHVGRALDPERFASDEQIRCAACNETFEAHRVREWAMEQASGLRIRIL